MTQVGWAYRKQRECGYRNDSCRCRVAAKRHALNAPPLVDLVRSLDGGLDEALHQRRRHLVSTARALGFHGRHDRRLQRGLMLLQIQRHLLVADTPHHWTHEEPPGKRTR